MKFDELNEETFLMFAIKHYENPHCVTREDFDEDLKRFKYLKRLLKRYVRGGPLRTHLIINHLIILYNVFGDAATPLLFYKGFLGLATYRAANCLWKNDSHTMALFLQNRASEVFGVDIHPAANIAGAVMMDHATGIVIGQTCNIESEVSIFQGVTLGGTGNESGKRHPDVKKGATIYASSTILGNIEIGACLLYTSDAADE